MSIWELITWAALCGSAITILTLGVVILGLWTGGRKRKGLRDPWRRY